MPSMSEQCVASLRNVLAFYKDHGCPCAFPRFGQLVQFDFRQYGNGPVGCHATEIAIALATDPESGFYQRLKPEMPEVTCRVCGSLADVQWEQYNINLAVTSMLFKIVHPQPKGPSPMGPIPMPRGFFGFQRADIDRVADIFSKEGSFDDMAAYLTELRQL